MCKTCGCGDPYDSHGGRMPAKKRPGREEKRAPSKKPSKPAPRPTRKKAAAVALAGALVAPGAFGIAQAQDTSAASETTVVSLGRHKYELPADEVFVLCVDAREDSLDAAELEVRPFFNVRGIFMPLPTYDAIAAGTLATAQKGDCFLPDGESITR